MCAFHQSSSSNTKVIFVGDSQVGKTTFIQKYLHNKFTTVQSTVLCDFFLKQVQYKGHNIKLEIWDTAGQQAYQNLISSFYRNTQAVIFTFSFVNLSSLDKLEFWFSDIANFFQEDIIKVVIATKYDLKDKEFDGIGNPVQVVTQQQIDNFMKNKRGVKFFFTSSQDSMNVKETFDYVIEKIVEKSSFIESLNDNNQNNHISLIETKSKKTGSQKAKEGCC